MHWVRRMYQQYNSTAVLQMYSLDLSISAFLLKIELQYRDCHLTTKERFVVANHL